jgi:hypothetical protein
MRTEPGTKRTKFLPDGRDGGGGGGPGAGRGGAGLGARPVVPDEQSLARVGALTVENRKQFAGPVSLLPPQWEKEAHLAVAWHRLQQPERPVFECAAMMFSWFA